jgi:hypothetical protein
LELKPEQGSPDWFVRFIRVLNGVFDGLVSPRLLIVDLPADLPDAPSWRGRMVWLNSINRPCFSNGVRWLRTDTGAFV